MTISDNTLISNSYVSKYLLGTIIVIVLTTVPIYLSNLV